MVKRIVLGIIAGLAAGVVYFLLMTILGGMVGPYLLGTLFSSGPTVIVEGALLGLTYGLWASEEMPTRYMPLRGLGCGLVIWLLAGLIRHRNGGVAATPLSGSLIDKALASSLLGCLLMGLVTVGGFDWLRLWSQRR
jgi:hypothetical protein